MLDKYKQNLQTYGHMALHYVLRLRDVRFAGQLLFVVVVLLVTWSGVKAIDANYTLEKQIATLQTQNNVQQLENSNIQLQNNYYESNQYLELSARQNFGLAAPGEKELLVPQNVALSYTVALPKTQVSSTNDHEPWYERNVQAWITFFLHRKTTN